MKALLKDSLPTNGEYQLSLGGDVAEIWARERQGAYRIPLELSARDIKA